MKRNNARDLGEGLKFLRRDLLDNGYEIQTKRWQGKDEPPVFLEILHADLMCPMSDSMDTASELTNASQPWANEHFLERVSGIPHNPPPSHVRWNTGTEDYLVDEKFSHTYPERMWSKGLHSGIRYDIGDLNTAVELLKGEPDTRQCYIPMWFPEDLAAANNGERVPCSFGWHFMLRGDELHCSYHMRSCDVVRHLHNDLFFANALTIWLIDQTGMKAKPGYIHFSSSSLHCFKNDLYTLRRLTK